MSDDPTNAFLTAAPIKLGSILFTLVEPTKGHEVEYNRWYERDHFYGGVLVGPFVLAGGRFVATKDLKAQRYPQESPINSDASTGSFLAMYWVIDGHHKDWNRWSRRQVKVLIDNDRMYPHRQHIHTQLYHYEGSVERDADGVPPELALDHRFPGLGIVIVNARGDREQAIAKLRDEILPAGIAGSDIAMVLMFTPFPMPPGQPSDVPASQDDDQRILLQFFSDTAPDDSWGERAKQLDESFGDVADVVFSSPFKPTVWGTDTYTDQLW